MKMLLEIVYCHYVVLSRFFAFRNKQKLCGFTPPQKKKKNCTHDCSQILLMIF